MTVRIVLATNEPIKRALRRLKNLLHRHGKPTELQQRESFIRATAIRRAKQFQKKYKAREATLLAKQAGEQPASSIAEAVRTFRRRTGKP
jgi:ribosomal protein S21